LSIATSKERNQAISEVNKAISSAGGWIVDHSLFSNKAANMNFEVPIAGMKKLLANLEIAGFHAVVEGELPVGEAGDVRGSAALTFVHQNPDLRRDVPAFG
jgi:hypothetical protein